MPDPPTKEEVRAHLSRLLAAPEWRGSSRRKRLLSYIVEEALSDSGQSLKGVSIAMAVFSRDATHQDGSDAIVRVEAHRLRKDLDSYYMDGGRHEPIRIRLPKGGYMPRFERNPDAPTAPMPTRVPSANHGHAVLVLPLRSLNQSSHGQALAASLTHELITVLSRFSGFQLHSAEESFQAAADRDAVAIGKEAGAIFVIAGTVLWDRTEFEVRLQAVDAVDGLVLWSENFRQPTDSRSLIEITSGIAAEIAAAIGYRYSSFIARLRERIAAANDPSWSSYLSVLDYYTYRMSHPREAYWSVRTNLESAVTNDPDYADAWAALAVILLDGYRFGYDSGSDRQKVLTEAQRAVERALVLDPDSIEAVLAQSALHHYCGHYRKSLEGVERALTLNPHDPVILAGLGWRLVLQGRFDEGKSFLDRTLDRSVRLNPSLYGPIACVHLMQGDYAALLEAAKIAAESRSGFAYSLLAIAQSYLGNAAATAEALRDMAEAQPLLAEDPACVYRGYYLHETLLDALVTGLDNARSVVANWRRSGQLEDEAPAEPLWTEDEVT